MYSNALPRVANSVFDTSLIRVMQNPLATWQNMSRVAGKNQYTWLHKKQRPWKCTWCWWVDMSLWAIALKLGYIPQLNYPLM
jgi:hypothetical protein